VGRAAVPAIDPRPPHLIEIKAVAVLIQQLGTELS
jgi:hypothetical protein